VVWMMWVSLAAALVLVAVAGRRFAAEHRPGV